MEMHIRSGWMPLVNQLMNELDQLVPGWKIVEVKEKFGVLCFNVSLPDGPNVDEARHRIQTVEWLCDTNPL